MKRVSVWIIKNRQKAWFALGLNFIVMLGIFVWMMPFYETNDDLTMCEFVDGSLGTADAHLIFQNYLLGMLYKVLYRLPGNLPWYALCQYLVLWLSFSAVTYVILQRMESFSGLCVTFFLLIYFAYEGYVVMQFSKVSGIAAGAGLFLLLYAVSQEHLSRGQLFCGWLLGCAGAMYRFDEFLVCSALMSGIGVWLLLNPGVKGKASRRKKTAVYAGVFGGLFLMAGGLYVFDQCMYQTDVWKYYDRYNDVRCELLDYGFPEYHSHRETFDRLQIDKDAYRLYAGWNINDPEKFSADVMEEITELQQRNTLEGSLLFRFLKEVPLKFFSIHVFYGMLMFLAFWGIWGRRDRGSVIALLYELVLFAAVYVFLFYLGRYLINRVDVGLWFAVSLVLIWMLDSKKMKLSGAECAVLCLGIFLVNQGTWCNDWRLNSENYLNGKARTRETLETVAADKEHLYLAKVNTLSGSGSFGPFDRIPEGTLENISWLGGWETNHAASLSVLEKWNITNPYREMIDRPDVYLIDKEIDQTLNYLRTYYDENAEAVLIKEVGGLKIYQILGSSRQEVSEGGEE